MSYLGDYADNALVILDGFTTNAADGGRESTSASLEEADITIYSDDGDGTFTAMTLDASTILITENPGAQVGVYLVAVDMSNDADFATGKDYVAVFYPDETVDSQSVSRIIGHWSCENRPLMDLSASVIAAINATVDTALSDIKLDHLVAVAESSDVVTDSVIGKLASTDGDFSNYVKGTDSLQSIRDALEDANPQNHEATANNETTGTLDSGTYSDTATVNDTYYQTSPAGAAVGGFGLNVDLTFSVGTGRVADHVEVTGYFDAAALRTVQVWAYDYNTAAYVQISNSGNDFGNAGSNQTYQYPMTTNMRQASDGEVKIRFTSTSTTTGDDFYCDYVNVTSIAQSAAGLTADAIQAAVWARADSGHDESTLGYNVSKLHLVHGDVVSATNANQFVIDAGVAVNDAYNGMLIMLEDKTDDHYEMRRIVDYIGATNEVFLDRDLGFTPVAADDYYIMGIGYADVNATHVAGTAQTANDNGADINAILVDTAGLNGDAMRGTDDAATAAGLATHDGKLDTVDTNVDAILVDTGTTLPATLSTMEGKIDTVDTNVDAVLVDTGTTLPASIAALNDVSTAEVNAEVADVLKTDTITDLANGAPPNEPTFEEAIMYGYSALINLIDVDSGFKEFYDKDGNLIWKKALGDDGSNYTEAKGEAGS